MKINYGPTVSVVALNQENTAGVTLPSSGSPQY